LGNASKQIIIKQAIKVKILVKFFDEQQEIAFFLTKSC